MFPSTAIIIFNGKVVFLLLCLLSELNAPTSIILFRSTFLVLPWGHLMDSYLPLDVFEVVYI
jgi:hypothetical protein